MRTRFAITVGLVMSGTYVLGESNEKAHVSSAIVSEQSSQVLLAQALVKPKDDSTDATAKMNAARDAVAKERMERRRQAQRMDKVRAAEERASKAARDAQAAAERAQQAAQAAEEKAREAAQAAEEKAREAAQAPTSRESPASNSMNTAKKEEKPADPHGPGGRPKRNLKEESASDPHDAGGRPKGDVKEKPDDPHAPGGRPKKNLKEKPIDPHFSGDRPRTDLELLLSQGLFKSVCYADSDANSLRRKGS